MPDSSISNDDSSLNDSQVVNDDSLTVTDSSIDSNTSCPTCAFVLQDCGMYATFPNLPISSMPPGEVCFTSQNYNILISWKNGNSTWQMCAIQK